MLLKLNSKISVVFLTHAPPSTMLGCLQANPRCRISSHSYLISSYFKISWQSFFIKSLESSAGDARDVGLIPGSGRSPGGGNGNPLQYSCLGNPLIRGIWQATVHGVSKSQTWLSNWAHSTPMNYTSIKNNIFKKASKRIYNLVEEKEGISREISHDTVSLYDFQ